MTATSQSRSPGTLWPGETPPVYISAQSRERLLRIALLITAGVGLLAALAAIERYRFASEGLRLGAVTPDRFDALGQRRGIIDLLLALAVAAAAVLWLTWFARVYANLRALGARWTRLSVPAAVVSCAVPVLNVFLAPRLVGEAWNGSDPQGPDQSLPGDRRFPPPLVLIWVGVALLTLLVGGLAEKTAHRTLQQLGPVRSGAPLEALAALLVVVSALVTVRLAAALTSRQESRTAQVTPGAEDAAP
jgi:hypothetical protein